MAAAGVTTRVSRLTLLLVLFAPLAVGWSADGWAKARGRGETNAGRLTRGLPPLPPRRLYNPSRAGAALARRSATPVTNNIRVSGVNPETGTTVTCYIAGDGSCTSSAAQGITLQTSVGEGSPDPQELYVTTAGYSGYNLIAVTSSDPTFSPTDSSGLASIFPYIGDTTSPGAGPSFDGSSFFYYESAIWYVDAQGVITATWINPDGTPVPLTFLLTGDGPMNTGTLYMSGSPDPATYTGAPFPVTFSIGA